MAELANCTRCGAVFVKSIRDICQNCYKKEEAAFKTVYAFLRQQKNREATMPEIIEATDVEEEMITKFIKEKRLRTSQFPKLAYSCERCGSSIVTGKLCSSCSQELLHDLEQAEKEKQQSEKRKQREINKTNTYYTMNREKNE